MGRRNVRNSNWKVRSKGSDESDEDYVISDYATSDASSDAVEEEEEAEEVILRWPKVKTGPRGNRKITVCEKPVKTTNDHQIVSDDEDLNDADVEEEECRRLGLGKRRKVFYDDDGEEEVELISLRDDDVSNERDDDVSNEKKDDGDYDDDGEEEVEEAKLNSLRDDDDDVSHEDDGDYKDEDGDEDFTADENVSLDEEDEEEEETVACKKRSVKVSRRGRKRKCGVGRKRRGKEDFVKPRKKAKTRTRRRRRYSVASDSDVVSSGESEYEYTVSEEEREQIREASSLLKHARKGTVAKDVPKSVKKVVKKKVELVKSVCGICLSEEDMRRLRGTLDCCSHYFCFTCIMEWSKVESRCPLCKQRFKTISKPARSTPGVDLREVVIPVPERDQVYQPTEEEMRSYFDPYENTICTECHQGEDDGLMLLCDICDSSAHTYCVGLGREVPEGNWYCEGCRPGALGSASSQTHTTSEQQRVSGFYTRPSPLVVSGQYQDASSLLVSPRTQFFNGEHLFSPRLPNGDGQVSSPSGLGATTLSRRRTLHRHIHNIINGDRLINMGSRSGGTSIANSSDGFTTTQTGHVRDTEASQRASTQAIGIPVYTISEERLPPNRLSNNTFIGGQPINLGLGNGLVQGVPFFGHQQHNLASYMPNIMPSTPGERLQQRVRAHLKNLSSQINLGQATFDEISTCSVHTILAACGLEHKSSEVHLVAPPVACPHDYMTTSCSSSSSSSSSLMKGCCYACFDSFVEDVVKMILDTRQPHWLRLGLQ